MELANALKKCKKVRFKTDLQRAPFGDFFFMPSSAKETLKLSSFDLVPRTTPRPAFFQRSYYSRLLIHAFIDESPNCNISEGAIAENDRWIAATAKGQIASFGLFTKQVYGLEVKKFNLFYLVYVSLQQYLKTTTLSEHQQLEKWHF